MLKILLFANNEGMKISDHSASKMFGTFSKSRYSHRNFSQLMDKPKFQLTFHSSLSIPIKNTKIFMSSNALENI